MAATAPERSDIEAAAGPTFQFRPGSRSLTHKPRGAPPPPAADDNRGKTFMVAGVRTDRMKYARQASAELPERIMTPTDERMSARHWKSASSRRNSTLEE